MKTIVLGHGFLGKAFEEHKYTVLSKKDFEFTGNVKELDKLNKYDIIINCIGKSNTRWCEKQENLESVILSNSLLPAALSEFCAKRNKKFVHISTGCLYDRTDIENTEDEFITAHCFYTVSKWLGESGCDKDRDLILRPRLYFSDKEESNNLLCKIRKFTTFTSDKKDSLSSTDLIVEATGALIRSKQSGIFNVAHEGSLSIKEIADICGLKGSDITADELRKREKLYLVNNVMSIDKLKKFYKPTHIKDAIALNNKKLNK